MEIPELLKKYNLKPKDTLGQNFLLNEETLEDIVDAAEIKKTDEVLEIGPGVATLTKLLAERARFVLAIEKDENFLQMITEALGDRLQGSGSKAKPKANVKLVLDDALHFNFQDLLKPGYKVVANIPYYITGKIVEMLLASKNRPSKIVLLVQKEVAQRITAKPGDMSILGISAQLYADARLIKIVPRTDFYPAPKVDSAVLVLDVLDEPRLNVDEKKFFRMVKACFAGKRKQLKNTLKNNLKLDAKTMSKIEAGVSFKLDVRPQDLNLDNWFELYPFIEEKI
jgi:16S rRNA (adenine1518-N6/adenine1519-N6)-dimethyltransferase